MFDEAVLRIEHQHREHLMLKSAQLDLQEVSHRLWRRPHVTPAQLRAEQPLCSLQDGSRDGQVGTGQRPKSLTPGPADAMMFLNVPS